MYNKKKLAERLGELRKDLEDKRRIAGVADYKLSYKKLSQEIEKKTGVLMSSTILCNYEDEENDKKMNVENLCALADYYDVSIEYLLGFFDVKTPDMAIRVISKKTGLSKKSIVSIKKIIRPKNYPHDIETQEDINRKIIVNTLLGSHTFNEIINKTNLLLEGYMLYNELYPTIEKYLNSGKSQQLSTTRIDFELWQLQKLIEKWVTNTINTILILREKNIEKV